MANPVTATWKIIGDIQRGILRVIGLILIIVILIALFGGFSGGDAFRLAGSGVLRLEPKGVLVEERTRVSPGDALQSMLLGGGQVREVLIDDVVYGLRAAAEDEDVTGVVMHLDGFAGGRPAALIAVAEEIRAFRESGKPVIAVANGYNNASWLLAAQADEVWMHPFGYADVSGFASIQPYFAELLESLQITVNLYRVGTFKSAVEPYIRNSMSDEDRESRAFVFDALWEDFTEVGETGIGLPDGALDDYTARAVELLEAAGGDAAVMARDNGVVTELVARPELEARLSERFGEAEEDGGLYDASDFFAYVADVREAPRGGRDTIAVIKAVGTILDGEADGGVVGGDIHARLIREAREDENVKAIVLRIDSGGGGVFASELIRDELEAARADGKVVIASMGGVAASGGYWIATPAQEIFAEPATITGSIGIFALIPSFERSLDAIGVNFDGVTTTEVAAGVSPLTGVSDTWDALLQLNIENGYERFISIVAEARGMTYEEVDAVAQGRIWTGEQALQRGLVDTLGGFDAALARAAELAELTEGEYEIKVFQEELEPLEQFLESLGLEAEGRSGPLARLFGEADRALATVNAYNDPNDLYAVCMECAAYRLGER